MAKKKRARKVRTTAPQWILFFIFVAFEIFAVLFVTYGIKNPISLVAAAIYAILEVLLSVCLFRTPVFVHGLVIIAQIIVGNIFSCRVIMIIFSILYFLSVVLLYYWTREERAK